MRHITKDRAFFARRYLSVGNKLVLRVIYVDPERKLIRLSILGITPKEEISQKRKYKKLKMIDGIIKLLSIKTNKPLLYLYENIVWPLYKMSKNPYILLELLLNERKKLKGIKLDNDIYTELIKIINFRLAQKPLKIKSYFKLTCLNFYGIDAIKESLLNGEKKGTQNIPVKFKIVASPIYECYINTTINNQLEAIEIMNEALLEVENTIKMKGGEYNFESKFIGEKEIKIYD